MTRHQKAQRRRASEKPQMFAPDGREIFRAYKNEYWYDMRLKDPCPFTRGFPGSESGSVEAAGRLIMTGRVAKIRCTDRTRDRVIWTLVRGPRVPGTPLFSVLPFRGDHVED